MFSNNKYTKLYYSIIENRRNSPLSKEEYGENHHIIPHSFGGKKDQINLVKLTAREHFLCHVLLIKMCSGKFKAKMICALNMMGWRHKSNQRYVNSKLYEKNKIKFSELMKTDEDRKQKISKSTKGVYVGIKSHHFGRKQSKEWIEKAAKGRLGRVVSQETRDKISKAQKGIRHPNNNTIEIREKISIALKGKRKPKRSEEHKKNLSISLRGHKKKPCSPEAIKRRIENRTRNYWVKKRGLCRYLNGDSR